MRSDKLYTGSASHYQSASITLFTENDPLAASTFLANSASIATVAKNNIGDSQTAIKPLFVSFSQFNTNSRSGSQIADLPVAKTGIATQQVFYLSVFGALTGAANVGPSVTFNLRTPDATSLLSINAPIPAGSPSGSGQLGISLTLESQSGSTNQAGDYQLRMSTLSAEMIGKAYCYLWVK